MTKLGQVLHVARKDLWLARGWVLGYVLLLLLVTAAVVLATGTEFRLLGRLALLIAAMVFTAVVIQADSPVRTDAFWVTLPLDPGAVLAAKLLTVVAVVTGTGLVAQAVALADFRAPAAAWPGLLGSTLMATLAILAPAVPLAALTRELKGFVLAILLYFMASTIVGTWLVMRASTGQDGLGSGRQALVIALPAAVALVGVAWHQYRSRHFPRIVALLALVLAGGTALTALTAGASGPGERPPVLATEDAPIVPLEYSIWEASGKLRVHIGLHGGRPGRAYTLHIESFHVAGPTGTSPLPLREPSMRLINPLPNGVGSRPADDGARRILEPDFTAAEQAALLDRAARLVLEGWIEAEEAREILRMPLAEGSVGRGAGLKMAVLPVAERSGTIHIQSQAVGRPQPWGMRREFTYLLQWADGNILPLRPVARSSTSAGLVLPGPDSWFQVAELVPNEMWQRQLAGSPELERAPGAQLVVYEWVSVGSHPVELTAVAR